MTTRSLFCLAAAGLIGAWMAGPLGCSKSDESTTQVTTTTTHTTTTHSGGHGGSGGGQGGNTGGTGGGVSGAQDFCDYACPFSVACGQGGAGGASGSWPPTLNDCMTGCLPIWADCTTAELATAHGCVAPNINPNCDLNAFIACLGVDGACANFPGSGGGAGGNG
jgi:hypothetical protein